MKDSKTCYLEVLLLCRCGSGKQCTRHMGTLWQFDLLEHKFKWIYILDQLFVLDLSPAYSLFVVKAAVLSRQRPQVQLKYFSEMWLRNDYLDHKAVSWSQGSNMAVLTLTLILELILQWRTCRHAYVALWIVQLQLQKVGVPANTALTLRMFNMQYHHDMHIKRPMLWILLLHEVHKESFKTKLHKHLISNHSTTSLTFY